MWIPRTQVNAGPPFRGVWVGSDDAILCPDGGETLLTWQANAPYSFDTDNMFDPLDPQSLTIRTAGKFVVGYSLNIGIDTTQTDFQTFSYLNGGTTLMGAGPNSFDNVQAWWGGVTTIQDLVAGDTLSVAVFNANSAHNDLAVNAFAPGSPQFWAYRIGD